MLKKHAVSALFFGLLILTITPSLTFADGGGECQQGFSNSSLNGSYSCSSTGTLNSGTTEFSTNVVGPASFKDGSLSSTFVLTSRVPNTGIPLIVCMYSSVGTYSVNSDGSFTLSATNTLAQGACTPTFSITEFGTISNSGQKTDFIGTSVTGAGIAVGQSIGTCTRQQLPEFHAAEHR